VARLGTAVRVERTVRLRPGQFRKLVRVVAQRRIGLLFGVSHPISVPAAKMVRQYHAVRKKTIMAIAWRYPPDSLSTGVERADPRSRSAV
jgi:hypothetical protein